MLAFFSLSLFATNSNVCRRDFNVLRKYLPEKYEYVVKIYMGDLQKRLYEKYLQIQNIDPAGLFANFEEKILIHFSRSAGFNTAKLFADYQYLMKVWTVGFCVNDFLRDEGEFFAASMVITTAFY